MAVMPGAVWRGNCANNSGPRNMTPIGVVLHVNDGPNVSLWAWVNSPTSDMSTTFQVLQDGTIEQYLDTDLVEWCQADGNRAYLSIECPTYPGEPMTAAQVAACGRIMAFVHGLYGIPLVLGERPGDSGLGWHGMGGAAWGGHTACPGDIRKSQRSAIIAAAGGESTSSNGATPITGNEEELNADDRKFVTDTVHSVIKGELGGTMDRIVKILAVLDEDALAVKTARYVGGGIPLPAGTGWNLPGLFSKIQGDDAGTKDRVVSILGAVQDLQSKTAGQTGPVEASLSDADVARIAGAVATLISQRMAA